MAVDYGNLSREYLGSVRSVYAAGRCLLEDLNEPEDLRDDSIAGLERASTLHDAGGAGFRNFMFETLESTPTSSREVPGQVVEDALATILTECQVANVLMAAGQAVGEQGFEPGKGAGDPTHLDTSLTRLDATRRAVEQSLMGAPGGLGAGRFGFAEVGSPPAFSPSENLEAAVTTFRAKSDAALSHLVQESRTAILGVFGSLRQLDHQKILDALGKLGSQLQELGGLGRLLRRGIEKLRGAFEALVRLLGPEAISAVKERLQKLWEDLQKGEKEYTTQALEWAYDVRSARERVNEILSRDDLQITKLDQASQDMDRLLPSFLESMKFLQGITAAVTMTGTVLALTPLVGTWLEGVAATAYLTVLAAIVLVGMDYTDSGLDLGRVCGVGEIANGLLTVPA